RPSPHSNGMPGKCDTGERPPCPRNGWDPASSLVAEVLEPGARLRGARAGPGRAALGDLGAADQLGDQLVDLDVPLHLADGDDGGLLPGVELHDAPGAVVAEPGDDHTVAGLEPGAGVGEAGVVLGLALEVGEALVERLPTPLGLGLRGQGPLAG